jgi:hypothetical protein
MFKMLKGNTKTMKNPFGKVKKIKGHWCSRSRDAEYIEKEYQSKFGDKRAIIDDTQL